MVPIERLALRALVVLDPKGSAKKILEIARRYTRADRAALYTVTSGRLSLIANYEVDQKDLDGVPAIWSDRQERLAAGHVVFGKDQVVAPIGQPVAALLYLVSPHLSRTTDEPLRVVLSKLGPLLELAVRTPIDGHVEKARLDYVEQTPLKDIEREKLVLVLTRSNWNISAAARVLGVSRRTIYKRLKKHSLARPEGSVPQRQRRCPQPVGP